MNRENITNKGYETIKYVFNKDSTKYPSLKIRL